jgi:hypothetical protein
MVLDLAVQEVVADPAKSDQQFERLRGDLQMLIESEPMEDGIRHPMEQRLHRELSDNPGIAPSSIHELFHEWQERPSFAAALLRGIGRCEASVVGQWGFDLASNALFHQDVEVRDAAVSALELWGGDQARQALQECLENEPVPYLARYMRQVVEDLSE